MLNLYHNLKLFRVHPATLFSQQIEEEQKTLEND